MRKITFEIQDVRLGHSTEVFDNLDAAKARFVELRELTS